MRKRLHLVDTIQILTGFAVFIGLILVVLELRQSEQLARAQLASDGYLEGMALRRSALSETFAQTMMKACLYPETLNESEIFEMSSYFGHLRLSIHRLRGYEDIGKGSLSFEQLRKMNIREWLSYELGRADYEDQRDSLARYITEIADELIRNGDLYSCNDEWTDYIELYRNRVGTAEETQSDA